MHYYLSIIMFKHITIISTTNLLKQDRIELNNYPHLGKLQKILYHSLVSLSQEYQELKMILNRIFSITLSEND